MKKIFSFVAFVLSFIQFINAQTPKLTGAFAASSALLLIVKAMFL